MVNDYRNGIVPLGQKMTVTLHDIKVASLSSQTIVLFAEFIHMARAREGIDLQMQQQDIVRRIFLLGGKTSNPDLILLFMRIKMHIIKYLHSSDLESNSIDSNYKVA